jgi:glycosyltransferase involved in cell wall biosynthesis
VVVTCHDLLAVRGSLGEETDCAASPLGKILQRWILRGLARASVIACVSTATLRDVERILQPAVGGAQTQLVPMGLNHDYRPLAPEEAEARLAASSLAGRPFVLHVGSNLRRKNREGVLRSFAGTAAQWNGQLVIAGQPLTPELWSLAGSLEITARIVEVTNPSNEMLEALYNRATALIFPSRFEGFGWPIIEAQACGCPVICSDIPPLPEVAGEAALVCAVEDVAGFSSAILRLANPGEREAWARKGLANVRRFATHRMIGDYLAIYERTNAQV